MSKLKPSSLKMGKETKLIRSSVYLRGAYLKRQNLENEVNNCD